MFILLLPFEPMVVDAKIVVEMLIQRCIEPDTVTYDLLIDGYCLLGQVDKAEKIFDLMTSKGSIVDAYRWI